MRSRDCRDSNSDSLQLRSLDKGVRITFGPFTAFVGGNGSGKSNVVDVLNFLRDAMHLGLSGAITARNGIDAVRRWSNGRPFNVSIEVEVVLKDGTATYGFELAGDKQEEYRVKWEKASILRGNDLVHFEIEGAKWSGPSGLQPLVNDTSLSLPIVGGDERFLPLFEELKSMAVYAVFPDTLREPQKYNLEKPIEPAQEVVCG